ncbi:hypothetical protein [Acetobacter sp. DsW_54]|uniref:hypothetical protein n=1 Tax=Acetobacter sp. DsW_54 TaxID=1670660 RepID=UPI0018E96DFF|nr:hypothetical protein [Acetobacter sp. DsW_54]
MLKAVRLKKAANAFAANTEFVVGISRGKGVPTARIETQSIVLDGRPDPLFFSVGRNCDHNATLLLDSVTEARLH